MKKQILLILIAVMMIAAFLPAAGLAETDPLPLSITADDIEGFYNGDIHAVEYEVMSDGKEVDDTTVYIRKGGTSSWILLDEYLDYLVNVEDSGSFDLKAVKAGYEETTDSAKLTIKPRIVVLQAEDGSWTYDGSSHTQPGYTENIELEKEYSMTKWSLTEDPEDSIGFAGGEGLDQVPMTSASTIRDAGTVDNEIDVSRITFTGSVKPGNYIFYYKKGTLEVTGAGVDFLRFPKARDLTYDGTAQVLVSPGALSEGGTANYAPGTDSTTAPASGWSTSIPTGTDTGTYYVWYKAVGDKNHLDSAARCITVTVKENPITSISVDKSAVTLEEGGTETVTAAVQPSNASETVTWESSDTAVATVDDTGVITAVAAGTAKITVKSTSGDVSAEVAVTVTKPVIPTHNVTYTGGNALFDDGNSGPVVDTAEEGTTVTFAVSATYAHKLSSVTVTDAGGNTVSLSGSGTGPYTFVMPAKDVTVTAVAELIRVNKVSLSPSSLTLTPGDTGKITALIEPENAWNKRLIWSSSDPDIASVASDGTVTARKEGTVLITALGDNGTSDSVTIVVGKIIPYTMIVGENQTILPSQESAIFSSNAEFSKFVEVRVDGKLPSRNWYKAQSGSTVITLQADFIRTLKPGDHILRIVSTDGYAETKFTVKALPSTGDTSMYLLWTGCLFLALGGIAVIIRKKKTSK